jgi:hypothetical protein
MVRSKGHVPGRSTTGKRKGQKGKIKRQASPAHWLMRKRNSRGPSGAKQHGPKQDMGQTEDNGRKEVMGKQKTTAQSMSWETMVMKNRGNVATATKRKQTVHLILLNFIWNWDMVWLLHCFSNAIQLRHFCTITKALSR